VYLVDLERLHAVTALLDIPDPPELAGKRGHKLTQRANAWEVTWRWPEAGKVWEDRQVAKL
jgi:hypothetical protein